jgi:hypothetical protein
MQEGIFIPESVEERRLQDWLFNPFRYVAGAVALALGLAAILVSAAICYVVPVHFDGVLDVHFVRPGPAWLFVAEGISAWLCMALVLQVFGAMLAPTRFRFIDMLGTQAMARWPYLFIAAVSYPPGFSRVMAYLAEEAKEAQHTVTISNADIGITVVAVVVTIPAMVWTVLLMYRGYSVAAGIVETRKRVISFLVALMAAEVIAKVAFVVMATSAGVLPRITPP